METEVLATMLGVALAALVAACGAGFRWMRSEFNERFDRLEGRVDRLEAKIDRLEVKVDILIMALARAGSLTDPQLATPRPSPFPPESEPVLRPPDTAPTETPEGRAWPAQTPPEIADPPRAPPESGGQPSADHPARRPPPEPFGPTAAPA